MPGRALRYFRRCPWQRPPRPSLSSTRPRKASGFLAALRGIYLMLGMPALPGARNGLAGAPAGSDGRVSTAKPATFGVCLEAICRLGQGDQLMAEATLTIASKNY